MSTPSLLGIAQNHKAEERKLLSQDEFRDTIIEAALQFDSVYEIYRTQMGLAHVIDLCKIILERLDRLEDELGMCDEECDE